MHLLGQASPRGSEMASSGLCRLELMGLPDTWAFRRAARGVVRQGLGRLFAGLNIPNKKPGEPLLEWAQAVLEELPGCELCLHYSLKHQQREHRGDPVKAFEGFCERAADLGVRRVLLVSGPRGPAADTVVVLERLRRHPAPGRLRIGVAFNACLPSEERREQERGRLVRKLRTRFVEDVWLNCGSDVEQLAAGAAFARTAAAAEVSRAAASGRREPGGSTAMQLFGSILLPNEAQLWQMRERPWNDVHFSTDYLSSLEGMTRCTGSVLESYSREGVEPIVESKVRSEDDLQQLEDLLLRSGYARGLADGEGKADTRDADASRRADGGPQSCQGVPGAPPEKRRAEDSNQATPESRPSGGAQPRRRWMPKGASVEDGRLSHYPPRGVTA